MASHLFDDSIFVVWTDRRWRHLRLNVTLAQVVIIFLWLRHNKPQTLYGTYC